VNIHAFVPALGRAALALTCVLGAAASAQQPARPAGPQVELQAEARREVPNDVINAAMSLEVSDADPAKVADALNRAQNAALAAARDFPLVRARTGYSQSYPVYDRAQKLTGWRGRAEVRLESRDFAQAAALIGRLQSSMQLSGMSFSVSPQSRQAAEDELLVEAIAAFRARAEIARKAIGTRAYRIQRLQVNTGGGFSPPPRPMLARGAMAAEVATPQLEGGLSQIVVTVQGSIEVE
jgi:predicted secreted protein